MSFDWDFLDETGTSMPSAGLVGDEPTFSAQGDAESWLGENWRELATKGVSAVSLREDGATKYGPMSLSEA